MVVWGDGWLDGWIFGWLDGGVFWLVGRLVGGVFWVVVWWPGCDCGCLLGWLCRSVGQSGGDLRPLLSPGEARAMIGQRLPSESRVPFGWDRGGLNILRPAWQARQWKDALP